jgi:signal transduction histidine kinase/DNA-binding NarL/FixJ family response regulator/putative methionine-R-sulfoxide reductase with GAF domain
MSDAHADQATVTSALAELAHAVASGRDLADILERVAEHARARLDVHRSAVVLLEADGRLRVAAARNFEMPFGEFRATHPRDGVVMTSITERRAVWSGNLLNDPAIDLSAVARKFIERAGFRAAAAAPLLAAGRMLGTLLVCRDEVRAFTEEEIRHLETFADQAAIAVEQARLSALEIARERQSEALVEIERELVGELSTERLFPLLVDRASRLVGARGSIYLFDPGRRALKRGWSDAFVPEEVWLQLGEGTGGVCAQERRGLLVPDYATWPHASQEFVARGVRCTMSQPLMSRGELLGVITMSRSGSDAAPFTSEDLAVLERFAAQAALALRNATLYDAAEQRRRGAQELTRIARALSETLSPVAVADRIVQSGVELFGVDFCYIRLLQPDGGLALLTSTDQFAPPGHVQPPGIGLSALALREGRAVWTDDVLSDPRVVLDEGTRRRWLARRRSALVVVPLRARGAITGILGMSRARTFSELDLELAQAFADQAGLALDNARLYDALRTSEEELRRAKDAAETANRAKSVFLANVSHELRTPLNAILGFAQVLRREPELPVRSQEGLAVIEQSGEHLLGLINEILDLAKVEAGAMDLQPGPCDLPRLLDGIAGIMRARAETKGLAFTAEWLSDLPGTVRTDERRLRQVLTNLLDNAIKYTDEGGVALKVGHHDGRVRFVVEDTGIGIPPEHLGRVFEAFHQVRDPSTHAEGTGLGLAICRTLVSLMGGTLEVTSVPGEGSRVWFALDLPEIPALARDADRPSRRIVSVRGDRRRILVADDGPDNRRLVRRLLEPLGFEVLEAVDGEDCLRQVRAAWPDTVLMDLRMPGMDGLEATRRIRATEGARRTVIIAISASAFEHHREQCREAGADDFLAKPFRLERLLELLRAYLGLELVYETAEDAQTPADGGAGQTTAVPPRAELDVLLDLAMRGDIRQLLDRAERLEREDGRQAPFVAELRALAERFQVKRLCQWLADAREDA